jgi:hypothetical protein
MGPLENHRRRSLAAPFLVQEETSMTATHTCPQCGEQALVVGGFNAIDYIKCRACSYYGDHWEEGGIVHDVSVPTEKGMRQVNDEAETNLKRLDEILTEKYRLQDRLKALKQEHKALTRKLGLPTWSADEYEDW